MAEEPLRPATETATDAVVSEDRLRVAEAFVEQEEGGTSRHRGLLGQATTALLVAMSLFHLYAALEIVPAQVLRPVHVGFMLVLVFLLFPVAAPYRHRLMWWDVVGAVLGFATIAYLLAGGDDIWDRNVTPSASDTFFGFAFLLLVLEACRRTSGWIMTFVIGAFVAYAFAGPWLPGEWSHRGYDIASLSGFLYQTLEGIFGTAVDVSSTLIILFTIYGAFLQQSGAGRFFLDWSFAAMGGRHASAGRTVVLASFLLGGPSGSGVATTVTIGSVAWPMLAKAGYGKEAAGGLLAAAGLGAIISPPVLGAAAFLIAEFLKIGYLDVIMMAVVPTCLYYLSLLAMVELDVRRFGMSEVAAARVMSLWELTRRYGFHFVSLVSIVAFLLLGFSPVLSVFWATVVTFAMSFLDRQNALFPRRLIRWRRHEVRFGPENRRLHHDRPPELGPADRSARRVHLAPPNQRRDNAVTGTGRGPGDRRHGRSGVGGGGGSGLGSRGRLCGRGRGRHGRLDRRLRRRGHRGSRSGGRLNDGRRCGHEDRILGLQGRRIGQRHGDRTGRLAGVRQAVGRLARHHGAGERPVARADSTRLHRVGDARGNPRGQRPAPAHRPVQVRHRSLGRDLIAQVGGVVQDPVQRGEQGRRCVPAKGERANVGHRHGVVDLPAGSDRLDACGRPELQGRLLDAEPG